MKSARRGALLLGLGCSALAGCGTTTVVDEPSTTLAGATTTAPTGTTDELLARLQAQAFTLSIAINDGEGAAALDQINALWKAASADMPRTVFVEQVEHQLALMQTAVERRRPADADKAARYVQLLITRRGVNPTP